MEAIVNTDFQIKKNKNQMFWNSLVSLGLHVFILKS